MAASTADIDRTEEIRSRSTDVYGQNKQERRLLGLIVHQKRLVGMAGYPL